MPLTEERREELIEGLISNEESIFDEDHQELLEDMTDNQLVALTDPEALDEVVNNAAKYQEQLANNTGGPGCGTKKGKKKGKMAHDQEDEEEMVGNEDDEQTFNEESLPAELREDLAYARTMKQQKKDQCIAKITENKSNPYSDEELAGMSLDSLQKLAQFVGNSSNGDSEGAKPKRKPTAKPTRRLGGHTPVKNQDDTDDLQDEILESPVINWETNK